MELVPVSFEELSNLTYSVALASHEKYATPEFAVVKFAGVYRSGSAGAADAVFLVAIIHAVQKAWFTDALIVDLTDLSYSWGG